MKIVGGKSLDCHQRLANFKSSGGTPLLAFHLLQPAAANATPASAHRCHPALQDLFRSLRPDNQNSSPSCGQDPLGSSRSSCRRKAPQSPVCQQVSSWPSGAQTPAELTMPPSQGPGVRSVVFAPDLALCRAAATPPQPPPQTTTSRCVIASGIWRGSRWACSLESVVAAVQRSSNFSDALHPYDSALLRQRSGPIWAAPTRHWLVMPWRGLSAFAWRR